MDSAIYWIGLGALLFVVELLTGSGFLLFFGASAFIVAVLPLVLPGMALSTQLIVFSVLSVLDALCWKLILKHRRVRKSDRPFLNKRAEQFIGQNFTLQSAITHGAGRVSIGDTIWQVRCNEDLPIGAIISVVGIEGAVLIVRHISDSQSE
ncbi:MAG: NfeD family protein [Gammaproteobacteria bacterium]